MLSPACRVRRGYVGRFAPSPSGPLHEGSLLAAMASYLDARAHGGKWLLRIEDIDTPRVAAGADQTIMAQLLALGLQWDGAPLWQSQRTPAYQAVFDLLTAQGDVYGCGCTRQDIQNRPYPGTCRHGVPNAKPVRAWRLRVPSGTVHFLDRWRGPQQQDVEIEVGDFILKRADGLWAYQLAVVVDDAYQGVTDIVRGADLLDSTARQRILGHKLGYRCPHVMHVPLLLDSSGCKLSKQNHAPPLDCSHPVETLTLAWRQLGFESLTHPPDISAFWRDAIPKWALRFNI